jgi:hypothetical protein
MSRNSSSSLEHWRRLARSLLRFCSSVSALDIYTSLESANLDITFLPFRRGNIRQGAGEAEEGGEEQLFKANAMANHSPMAMANRSSQILARNTMYIRAIIKQRNTLRWSCSLLPSLFLPIPPKTQDSSEDLLMHCSF